MDDNSFSLSAERVRKHLSTRNGEHLAFIKTYGCQQNFADSEKICGMLSAMGYKITDSINNAEFIVFNTCAIRENAEQKVFGNIGILKKAHEENPEMIIAVCGCMAQQEHIAEKIKKSYPFVDLVFGTHAVPRLPELILSHLERHKRLFDIATGKGCMDEELPVMRMGKVKASLPIMHGCDNFCTYCVVPLVRGREESRKPQMIINEAKEIISNGYKEIMLLGQNVNSYGKGLEENIMFADLLREINDIDGDFRIRFMTSHPKDCSEELLRAMAECEKVANYIHLPVQSGSNRILKEMNRRYTAEHYLGLLDMAREIVPGITVTSDIIVGFPGETQKDFEDTLKLSEKARWLMTYSFIYSKRVGTKAALMEDLTTDEEKHARFNELLALQSDISRDINASFVGKTVRVLFDGEAEVEEGYISGRSDENVVVRAPKEMVSKGFNKVYLKDSLGWALDGDIIK